MDKQNSSAFQEKKLQNNDFIAISKVQVNQENEEKKTPTAPVIGAKKYKTKLKIAMETQVILDETHHEKKVLWKCFDKVPLQNDNIMIELSIHHCNELVSHYQVPNNFLIDNNHLLRHYTVEKEKSVLCASYKNHQNIQFKQVCLTVPLKMQIKELRQYVLYKINQQNKGQYGLKPHQVDFLNKSNLSLENRSTTLPKPVDECSIADLIKINMIESKYCKLNAFELGIRNKSRRNDRMDTLMAENIQYAEQIYQQLTHLSRKYKNQVDSLKRMIESPDLVKLERLIYSIMAS